MMRPDIVDPDSGDLLFSEVYEAAVGRFHIDRIDTLGCESLVAGENPCMDIANLPVEGGAPSHQHFVHSAAVDEGFDEIWYTYGTYHNDKDDQIQSVGVVCDGLASPAIALPPLYASVSGYPAELLDGKQLSSFAGILVDDDSHNVWSAGYGARDVGHLTRIKPIGPICPETN